MRSPLEETVSPTLARKKMAEEKEVAETPGWEVKKPGALTGAS